MRYLRPHVAFLSVCLWGALGFYPLVAQDFSYAETDLQPYAQKAPAEKQALYFNQSGFTEYESGNYRKAAALFSRAFTIDPTLVVAHWNFACALSLLRRADPCDAEYIEDIEAHLKAAIRLEPGRRAKLLTDSDLVPIRNFPFFTLLLLNPSLSSEELLRRIPLWYGPQPGVFPASPTVHFESKGNAVFHFFDAAGETPGFGPETPARWVLNGETITITVQQEKPTTYKGKVHLSTDGFFVTTFSIELPGLGILGISEDNCGA